MSGATVFDQVMRLTTSTEALAAIGAHLRLRTEGIDADPRVAELLAQVAEAAVSVAELPAEQQSQVLGAIRAFFAQAFDLLEDPGRAPGWVYTDPVVLQSQGRASAVVVDLLGTIGLDPVLARQGAAFLDVGTGAGWLAIAAARRHPGLRVVGVDCFAPALALARDNVRSSGLEDRVSLVDSDVTDLDEESAFDLAWLPAPFLPESVMPAAVAAVGRALRPGGTLVVGVYRAREDALSSLLSDLRTVRGGGHAWRGPELAALLEDAGLADVVEAEVPPTALLRLVTGTRP